MLHQSMTYECGLFSELVQSANICFEFSTNTSEYYADKH